MSTYVVFKLLAAVAPHVPRRVGLACFRALAPLAARLSPARHGVRDNLRHVLGRGASDGEIDRVVTEVFRTQLANYFDLFFFPGRPPEEISKAVTILPGAERLRTLAATPPGVILVGAHLGNLEVAASSLALQGLGMVCVVERLRPDALYRLVSRLRSTRGLRLVPADAPTAPVLRGLRDGFAVCLAADRDVTGSGVDTTFFGAVARLPDGYARLARRTGSAVVVALPIRNHDDTITVDALLVETPPPSADVEADIRAIVRAVLAVVEECVAANPGQWVMFQRVWSDARPVVGGAGPARTPVA